MNQRFNEQNQKFGSFHNQLKDYSEECKSNFSKLNERLDMHIDRANNIFSGIETDIKSYEGVGKVYPNHSGKG